jgi:hypothetical protein
MGDMFYIFTNIYTYVVVQMLCGMCSFFVLLIFIFLIVSLFQMLPHFFFSLVVVCLMFIAPSGGGGGGGHGSTMGRSGHTWEPRSTVRRRGRDDEESTA